MIKNLLKYKKSIRSTRVQTRAEYGLFSSKRSQESIGMSFNMIFSIILIIFFLVAAFVAIKYFLGYQKEIQLRTYFQDFQGKVNEFWNSGGSVANENIFGGEKTLPSGIDALCYLNFSLGVSDYSGSDADNKNCEEIKKNMGVRNANFAFHSSNYDKVMKTAGYKLIEHISLDSLNGENCYCFLADSKGKIKIKILTSTDSPIVKIEKITG